MRTALADLALSSLIVQAALCTYQRRNNDDVQQGYPVAKQTGRPAGAPRRSGAPLRTAAGPGRRSGPGPRRKPGTLSAEAAQVPGAGRNRRTAAHRQCGYCIEAHGATLQKPSRGLEPRELVCFQTSASHYGEARPHVGRPFPDKRFSLWRSASPRGDARVSSVELDSAGSARLGWVANCVNSRPPSKSAISRRRSAGNGLAG